MGIGGVGMSAIARVLLTRGVEVSGSDLVESPVISELRRLGARVAIGHDAQHIGDATEVILSSAISATNPEVVAARHRGIAVRHRAEVLAEILNAAQGIAVAGAHGKTTVTSMIAWSLEHAGASPTFLIGGEMQGIGGAKVGAGPYLVAEADESDGTLRMYRPLVAVVTSIEPDHLENFNDDFQGLKASYAAFLANVKPSGHAVLCADDPTVCEVAEGVGLRSERAVTYGLEARAAYRGSDLRHEGLSTTFSVQRNGEPLGRFTISVPGRHNVQNALACIAVCDLAGIDLESVRAHLPRFHGAKRRFEVLSEKGEILVVNDYAHHPSEVKATIGAAKAGWNRRLIALFQPHRYSRMKKLLHDFARAFDDADHAIITDVYAPPPEEKIPGVSSSVLVALLQQRLGTSRATYAPSAADCVQSVSALLRPGDIVLVMGAGDIWRVAEALARTDFSGKTTRDADRVRSPQPEGPDAG